MKLMRTLFPILALLVLAVISSGGAATASTIHYWRFENSPGFLADSVGASTLTAAGSPTQTVLPLSGAGSAFDEAIPGTTRAIGVNSVDFATTASFPHGDFTVEALAHANILIGAFGQTLVAMGDTQVNSEAAWLLQFRAGELMLVLCSGSSCELVAGGLTVSSGRDYYAAASVDLDGLTTTLYLQDLTGAGPLQSASVGHTYSSLNSPAGFGIGALANGDLSFDGLIDEVRISNHARSESELLVNAPETFVPAVGPLGLVAIGSALALVGVLAHRRTDTPRRATGAAG